MIERVVAARRSKVGQSTADGSCAVGGLVGPGEVKASGAPEPGRAQGDLARRDQRAGDRDRKEDVRVADRIMVEEILHPGAEVIDIDGPAAQRNADSDLPLIIALTVQGKERECALASKLEQRAREGLERRRLVVLAPEAAH